MRKMLYSERQYSSFEWLGSLIAHLDLEKRGRENVEEETCPLSIFYCKQVINILFSFHIQMGPYAILRDFAALIYVLCFSFSISTL